MTTNARIKIVFTIATSSTYGLNTVLPDGPTARGAVTS
jgi:hypothetical protein